MVKPVRNINPKKPLDNNNIPGYKRTETNPYKGVIGDWTDWLAFYRANHKLITAKAGKNRSSIFYWATKFKRTNPVHLLTTGHL